MKRLEQRQKELNEEKKRLHEMEEMLKKEKENFADERFVAKMKSFERSSVCFF